MRTIYETGKYEEAIEKLKDAVAAQQDELKPDGFKIRAYLALSYFKVGSESAAVTEMHAAEALAPSDVSMSPFFCTALITAKLYAEGVSACQKASASEPEAAGYHAALGLSLNVNGKGR